MDTILVNIDSKKETFFFMELVKKMRFSARVLSRKEKEDIALLNLMKSRENEVNLPVDSACRILDNIK